MVSIRTRLMLCLFISLLVSSISAAITKIASDDFNGIIGTKNSVRTLNNGLGGTASLAWQSENPTVSALVAHPYDGTVALNTGTGSDYFAPPVANSNTYAVEVLLSIDPVLNAWHTIAIEKNPASPGLWGTGGFGCSFSGGWLQAAKWGAFSDTSLPNPSGYHAFAGLGYNSGDKDANGNIPIRIEYTVSDRSTTSSITVTIYSNNAWKAQYAITDFKPTAHAVALIGGNGRGIWDNLLLSQITVDPTPTVTATPTPAPTPTPVAWFSEGLRRFNAPIGYDANYHNAVMAELPSYIDLDANFWVITADVIGYAYYNSAVATKAPGLGSIDSLRTILTEVRKTKPATRFVAYMNVRSPMESLTHSNWRAYDWNGNTIMYNGAYQVCLNTPYTEEFLKPMMAELLAAPYNMDGFWFDGICLNTNECRCSYCQALFKSQTGLRFPDRRFDEFGQSRL